MMINNRLKKSKLYKPTGVMIAILALPLALWVSNAQSAEASAKLYNPVLAKQVPDLYKKRGYVVVASEIYPTAVINQSGDKPPVGVEPDTAKALGEMLGIDFRIKIVPFASVLPGLDAGRYDLAMGFISITPERRKVVNFVTEHRSTRAVIAKASANYDIKDKFDLCGLKVAVLVGSAQIKAVKAAAKACQESSKPPIKIMNYQTQTQAILSVSSGRADVAYAGFSTLTYTAMQQKGEFDVFPLYGDWTQSNLTGIALPNNETSREFAKVLVKAMNELIEKGIYKKIYDEWMDGKGMIEESKFLPATS